MMRKATCISVAMVLAMSVSIGIGQSVQLIDSSENQKSWIWRTPVPYSQAIQLTNFGPAPSAFRLHFNNGLHYSMNEFAATISGMEPTYPGESVQRKIWRYIIDHKYNFVPITHNSWPHSPLITLNSIGFGYCRDFAFVS